MDSRTIADSRILARKQGDQRLILAQGHTGQAPDPAIGVTGYSEGRAGDRGVMRPRIVLKGVEQPRQFGEQALIGVLEGAAPMKRVGQELAVAIKRDTSENRLSAGIERREVRRDPIWRHLAVGVGRQDHAILVSAFHKPSLGKVHRRAAGGASMRGFGRKPSFNDADVKRPAFRQSSGDARALIGAIVREYDDADQPRRNRAPQPVALMSKGAQASRKPLLFIADGNGHYKARPDW